MVLNFSLSTEEHDSSFLMGTSSGQKNIGEVYFSQTSQDFAFGRQTDGKEFGEGQERDLFLVIFLLESPSKMVRFGMPYLWNSVLS